MKSGYEECVSITRFTMNVVGVWPNPKSNISWFSRYQFVIPLFFMLFFVIIPQTTMLPIVWGDLNLVLEILNTIDIIVSIAFFKLLGIWYHKKDLNILLLEMKDDWKNSKEEERQIMLQNVKFGNRIIIGLLVLTSATLMLYTITALIILNSFNKQISTTFNETTSKPLFVKSNFFFNTNYSPMFEIIWICQFIAGLSAQFAFISFDNFFIISILHLVGQLTNLKIVIKNIMNHSTKQTFTDLLRPIVRRHIHLCNFTNKIEDNFNRVFLVQMVCYSVSLCMEGYQLVIIVSNDFSNESITLLAYILIYTVANMMSLFLYCFIAEKLRNESMSLFSTTYEIHWYYLKPKQSKMLLNLMYVTKTPLKLTAGKFAELSIEYFMTVLKTAAGYLSMLLAVKNKL